MQRSINLLRALFCACAVLMAVVKIDAAAPTSFQVTIPPETWYPCAWSFQDKTVANAFPSAGDGEKIALWDSVNNTWAVTDTHSPLSHTWTPSANFVITNGAGFLYYNPSTTVSLVLTVSGTPMTNDVTFNFVAGHQYLIGPAILYSTSISHGQPYGGAGNSFMECVLDQIGSFYHYTDYSLGYSSNPGDIVFTWFDPATDWHGGLRVSDGGNCTNFSPFWQTYPNPTSCDDKAFSNWTSPDLTPGKGFWFYPASNVTWTNPITQVHCQ